MLRSMVAQGLQALYITDLAKWCAIDFASSLSNPLFYAHNLYLNGTLVTEFKIPEGVTNIGDHAFYGCTGLTSIIIPNSVTYIGEWAFANCGTFEILFEGKQEEWERIRKGSYWWAYSGCSVTYLK